MTDEELAKFFHETYEEIAPLFGYETRKESAVPWDQVPEKNRFLMIEVARRAKNRLFDEWKVSVVDALRDALRWV